MPTTTQVLTIDDVESFADSCFIASDRRRIGAEVEFITARAADPLAPIPIAELQQVVDGVALRGHLTFEPGGQLEIVSEPRARLADVAADIAADFAALSRALGARGVSLIGAGLDPYRGERRVLRAPRYDAMEAFFDCDGLSGRIMMSRTAAIQVNVDFGAESDWSLVHRAGPVMAAAFANSPLYCGVPSGWRSARLSTWRGIDRTRTAPVGGDGPEAWARYLLDARVMLIRRSAEDFVPMVRPFTFAEWMRDGHMLGWPDGDDLAYHASTVFPPVRPRGWMELRMCDALPDPWWIVPVAVWLAVIEDGSWAGDTSMFWSIAGRDGLTNPTLARAASELFAIALATLPPGSVRDVVAEYRDRWVARARTPADDVLDSVNAFTLDRRPAWI